MDGLAKIFVFILLFFFFTGVYVALSPSVFTRMGEINSSEVIDSLEAQKYDLLVYITELEERVESAERLAESAEQKLQEAEQNASQAAQDAQRANQSLQDTLQVLFVVREELEQAQSDVFVLEEQNRIVRKESQETFAELRKAKSLINEQKSVVGRLKPLAAITEQAQQKVLLYRNGTFIALVLSIILGTIYYRRQKAVKSTVLSSFGEQNIPDTDTVSDLIEAIQQEDVLN